MTNRSDKGGDAAEVMRPPLFETALAFDLLLVPREVPGVLIIDLLMRDQHGQLLPVSSYGVSVPTFDGDSRAAEAWARVACEKFDRGLLDTLTEALGLHFADCSALSLIEQGREFYGKRGVLRTHIDTQEKLLRERLKLGPGRPAKWAAKELAAVIRTAMEALPKARRTYASVAKKIQEMYPQRAFKSGESLRKTVEDSEIDWMGIKKDVEKRS